MAKGRADLINGYETCHANIVIYINHLVAENYSDLINVDIIESLKSTTRRLTLWKLTFMKVVPLEVFMLVIYWLISVNAIGIHECPN